MPATFEELIGRHLDELYSAAICFTQDEHEAEVLLQQVAVAGFHDYNQRVDVQDFDAWILERLVSEFLALERRRGREPLGPVAAPGDQEMNGAKAMWPGPAPGIPEDGRAWLEGVLGRSWKELDVGDRVVLWLADVERYRHSRIAGLLGLSDEQVRNRHYRGRRTLSRAVRRRLGRRELGGSEA